MKTWENRNFEYFSNIMFHLSQLTKSKFEKFKSSKRPVRETVKGWFLPFHFYSILFCIIFSEFENVCFHVFFLRKRKVILTFFRLQNLQLMKPFSRKFSISQTNFPKELYSKGIISQRNYIPKELFLKGTISQRIFPKEIMYPKGIISQRNYIPKDISKRNYVS